MNLNIPDLTLNNGVKMPQLGFGVFQISPGRDVYDAVTLAFKNGYRSIDTAAGYANEAGVGEAFRDSGLKRDEVFITTKLFNTDQGYDNALRAFETSMNELKLDYLDLYLIHWPLPMYGLYVETWKALEKLYNEKRIRAIGVSNFEPVHLDELAAKCDIVPAVNQIELHPRLTQKPLLAYCKQHGIIVEAWSPLMKSGEVLKDPIITDLAGKYNKSAAQIVLRWDVQLGIVTIPKSVHEHRIVENSDIFDFALTDEEMARIDTLNQNIRTGPDPYTFSKR